MANVLVVAAASDHRRALTSSLSERGFAITVTPMLMGALPALAAAQVDAIVVEPSHPDDMVVLSALSNVCPLPPVMLLGPSSGPPLPMRTPAVRRVAATLPPPAVAKQVDDLIASCREESAPHLPFRMCAETDAKWTNRLVAERADDGFDGRTESDGYILP